MIALLPLLCLHAASGAYRSEAAGWIQVHLAGAPSQIGFDYGHLLGKEIDDAQKALHDQLKRDTGKPWSYFRDVSQKLYWSKVDPEYQQEMEGQAEGLKADGYSYDKWDVLAMNAYIEVHDYYMPWSDSHPNHKESCSAFIATGSETADGKIVMGQNFWWDYQTGERFNVLLDVTPTHGHRFVMDCLPGFLHSGTDFAVNDAGIVLTETTLPPLNDYDPNGIPEFVRMRKSIQYSSNIDDLVRIMKDGNNGGYANTWLFGDTKTGEIGKLELGLKDVSLVRKKDGYFCGANFPEDSKLIQDEIGEWDTNPKTNGCEARKLRWQQLLGATAGRVDAKAAMGFLGDSVDPNSGSPSGGEFSICGKTPTWGSNNAKVITSDLAASLSFWGRMGISDGSSLSFGKQSPFLKDIVGHPWKLFSPIPSPTGSDQTH